VQNPQLTAKEFETLVLIYAAHADYNYSESEESFIKAHTASTDYEKMLALFNSNSDYNILRTVLENKKRFCTNKDKTESLHQLIIQVFKADGDYSRPEKIFLEFLDRMIES